MDKRNDRLDDYCTDCLEYIELLTAALKFGSPAQVEEVADTMRRKLYDLSCLASQLKE